MALANSCWKWHCVVRDNSYIIIENLLFFLTEYDSNDHVYLTSAAIFCVSKPLARLVTSLMRPMGLFESKCLSFGQKNTTTLHFDDIMVHYLLPILTVVPIVIDQHLILNHGYFDINKISASRAFSLDANLFIAPNITTVPTLPYLNNFLWQIVYKFNPLEMKIMTLHCSLYPSLDLCQPLHETSKGFMYLRRYRWLFVPFFVLFVLGILIFYKILNCAT